MTNDQLIQFIDALKTDVINSLQANGTADTGQLQITTDDGSVQLQLPGHMQYLETGRGPTGPDAPAGDPPMIVRIQQWCQAKGIPASAAWAIKKSIDKNGYNGKPGILSIPLGEDNISRRLAPALENMGRQLTDLLMAAIQI